MRVWAGIGSPPRWSAGCMAGSVVSKMGDSLLAEETVTPSLGHRLDSESDAELNG